MRMWTACDPRACHSGTPGGWLKGAQEVTGRSPQTGKFVWGRNRASCPRGGRWLRSFPETFSVSIAGERGPAAVGWPGGACCAAGGARIASGRAPRGLVPQGGGLESLR